MHRILSRPFILLLVVLSYQFLPHFAISQSTTNIGFETGTFNGWNGATGQCCPVYAPTQGIDTLRHVITSFPFADPFSLGSIPVVAPGSGFSARLGNSSGSAESEMLNYTFTVPSDSLLLVIRFAVVLENANHPAVKQPRFAYTVTNSGIPLSGCLNEQVTAGNTSYNFLVNGAYEYLGWQQRVIHLPQHTGENVTVHFETGDCEPGGHFGYAYVDAQIVPDRIDFRACNPDGSITLFKPAGVDGIWIDGSDGDSLVIQNPGTTNIFAFTPAGGCGLTLEANTGTIFPYVDIVPQYTCGNNLFFQQVIPHNDPYTFLYDFGDGQISNSENPAHTYSETGNYIVVVGITGLNNCKSEVEIPVDVVVPPVAGFEIDHACVHQPLEIINTSSGSGDLSFEWYLNTDLVSIHVDPQITIHSTGQYHIILIVTNSVNCSNIYGKIIEVRDDESCNQSETIYFPNAFTPDGNGMNDIFQPLGSVKEGVLRVFDRYGKIISFGNSWDGAGWPQGVYGYRYSGIKNQKTFSITGTVTLIR